MNPSPQPARRAAAHNTAVEAAIRPDYSPEQRAAWLKRHEEFVALARQGGAEIVFLGDSITDTWRTRGLAAWQRLLGPLRALNLGIPGDRTQQVLWRIEYGELEHFSPRAVCLLIGTNNLDPGLGQPSLTPRNTPDEIVAGILAVVDAIMLRFPRAALVLHALFPRGEPLSPVRAEIVTINATLHARVTGRARIRFVDFGPLLLARGDNELPRFEPDGLHLSAAGYDAWAAGLAEVFAELGLREPSGHAPARPR